MARTKGALNKKTRQALNDAEKGKLGDDAILFLDKVRRDPRKDEGLRIEATKAMLPYCKPKLSQVEMSRTDPNEGKTQEQQLAEFVEVLVRSPDVLQAAVNKSPEILARLMSANPQLVSDYLEKVIPLRAAG